MHHIELCGYTSVYFSSLLWLESRFIHSGIKYSSWTPTATAAAAKSLQSCPTLCDPIDSSPPGSAVPGILQARTLEWVAVAFSGHACILVCKFLFIPIMSAQVLPSLQNAV